MNIVLDAQTIISAAAVIAAIGALIGVFGKGYDFVKRQKKQDKDIAAIRSEQQLLTYGVLACLKGLKEQGCNGPVTQAIEKIEKHLNEEAHKSET